MKRKLLLTVFLIGLIFCGVVVLVTGYSTIFLTKENTVLDQIPIYPGVAQTSYFSTKWPDSTPGAGLAYKVNAEPKQIFDFYRPRLNEAHWILEPSQGTLPLEGKGRLLFRKDKFWCQISIYGDTSPFAVNIIVSQRPL